MSRRLHFVFLAVGVIAFALLIWRVGPLQLLEDIRRAGWVLLPVVLVYAAVYLGSSEAWRLTMPIRPPPVSHPRAFALTAWGYALNYVTPMVSVGGEPFKILAASQWLGKRAATASVLSLRLLHVQAHLLFFLAGVVVAALLLPRGAVGWLALIITGLVLVALGLLLMRVHRRGGVEWLIRVVQRLPLVRRRAAWLESKRPGAAEVDGHIRAFYLESPRRYAGALALEFASRCMSVVELMLIAHAIGLSIGYWTAFLITSFASLFVNMFFFVPFALGAREGGLYMIFGLLGLPPSLGVVASLIGRLREMSWTALGLLLGFVAGKREPGS